jgi:hypothetical protein
MSRESSSLSRFVVSALVGIVAMMAADFVVAPIVRSLGYKLGVPLLAAFEFPHWGHFLFAFVAGFLAASLYKSGREIKPWQKALIGLFFVLCALGYYVDLMAKDIMRTHGPCGELQGPC